MFLGGSNLALGALQITPDSQNSDLENQMGRVLYKTPFRLWKPGRSTIASFNATFTLNIYPKTNPIGGEGLAFIITSEPDLPGNSNGQWLGIANETTNLSPLNSIVAVEFDTKKSYMDDIDGNHVGVDVDGINSINQLSLAGTGVNLSGGEDVTVNVRYDGVSKSLAFISTDVKGRKISLFLILIILIAILIAVLILVIIGMGIKLRLLIRRIRNLVTGAPPSIGPRNFRYEEIQAGTDNFRTVLGRGGQGTVYKGHLRGKDVAVKRINMERQGAEETFEAEAVISQLYHRNLVKLIGWCTGERESLLVYEYFPKGSLDRILFPSEGCPAAAQELAKLTWAVRRDIITGVASALEYLHDLCQRNSVLHRDVKASNVMLDDHRRARLGDFGLRRILLSGDTHTSTRTAGTPGFIAPECYINGQASRESDVFAFGVFSMEVVCGRVTYDQHEECPYIVDWLWHHHGSGLITSAVDRRLENVDVEEARRVLVLSLACCHTNHRMRPTIRTVLRVLSGEDPVPVVPLVRPPMERFARKFLSSSPSVL
ncbi:putative L-type lectin-domain containing receptor kinase S.5 [Acorus gramineus]|uniref:non-specific serine/threonine protein kinase n=1 Tax=Acorus gramineus TaxID=55184 RepID=A0AAV9BD06_ACOGR|nr:putative L-type lectin-domain containing receptor kinase S.5 [Acorus gramineus]